MNTKTVVRALLVLLLTLSVGVVAAAQAAQSTPAAVKKGAVKSRTATPALPSLTWRGDQCTARAFMQDLAHDYEASKQGRIVLQPFSTVSGLDAVNTGSADLAGSARPPMPGRAEEAKTNFYPVAWDALVMITSPKNPVGNITLKQLHDIYLGRVTDWSALGGEGAINLYAVAGPLDGNEYSLRYLLFHYGDQDVAVPRLYVNTEKLEEAIAIDPHGLGLTTLSAAHANPALKILTVENVTASTATIADGSYPLYSTLFLAARVDATHKDEIDKFVRYTTSDAALAVLRRHDLVPYGDAPNLPGLQAQRTAFIDAHVRPELVAAAAAAPGAAPVSAPVATADYLVRTEPNSEKTQQAKAHAEQVIEERKAQSAAKPDGS